MDAGDRARFGSFAAGQAALANGVFRDLENDFGPGLVFLFCPTPYCGRMAAAGLGGEGYLDDVGEMLDPRIGVFWTGPEIVSAEISAEHATAMAGRLKRKPVLWDNLFANDYDLRRLYLGPFDGRPPEPEKCLSGVLINPNCEFEANYVAVQTLARYRRGTLTDPGQAYVDALREWLPAFESVGGDAWTLDDLRLLGDIFYLPHRQGRAAEEIITAARQLTAPSPRNRGEVESRFLRYAERVESVFVKLTELKNRELFYTFNRQWWEIREEMQLLKRFLLWRRGAGAGGAAFYSPEHLPGTFRGGLVHRLQGLLTMAPDGALATAD
jgi:protein O-GlcNAcase/histone acetyltransferase